MEEQYQKTMQMVKGSFLTFKQEEVILANGNSAFRDVVYHPGAVGILAITAQEEIIMVRQYRYPVREFLYEIPAGKLEEGEEPLITAKRELGEETGYEAENWTKLSSFYPAPGFCDERMHLYLAEALNETGTAKPDPDELITADKIPLKEALQMILTGEIRDAKSILAILWYQYRK